MGEEAAAPPTTQISSPRGLTTRHVGYFGHLPEDTIHPRLSMVHLMSKGIQHAAKTRMASIPKGSPCALNLGLPAHPRGPSLTCPAHPAPPQRGQTCVSKPGCSQTPFPAVDLVGP